MSISAEDYRYMADALRLARLGLYTTDPNPAVGCIIVNLEGEVVGQGWHERAGMLHAEPLALLQAGAAAADATAYVTLEPCSHHGRTPPCADQLIQAGIKRVVYAAEDPNPIVSGAGAQRMRAAGIEVDGGILASEADELNRGYVQRMVTGRPWVRSKIAVSLDGRTALANGESQWITGEQARADVHRWRACSSAVLTGSGTVLADDPSLNARPEGISHFTQPLRVVLDSGLRTPVTAKLFQTEGPVLICHCSDDSLRLDALTAKGAELLRVPGHGPGEVALESMLEKLAERGINDVWLEAGALLNGAFLNDDLIDELIVYQAGSILGDSSQGMFGIEPLKSMKARKQFDLTDVCRIGDDVRLTWRPELKKSA
ncbi:MAG: bifunctional diaminohydroxyphosphoribosylaminopyrimidine deaminase/5-amino-6-(5-phosphoribosylamino)uracil reductase RibD [Gammaproteobacteria bacterium]|nr:bifunctional diaminohydroxyphosphoribosylaminopyrimidine deaminase/5-amino-6-(5-phosphoribosylamino)uracil reductase RibD [Gammaproteobacteria bacterium]MCP4088914.1 bifunctional diaminohydroxyphosphoribosylaminopyrimidine deaminase/5-amino-6-(5-phosphoribosylamino)uracil reductase RibD [Gammaproteobacteria bacterium]MCP4274930.1 bifunctional diaminohydroxyphosphoribosylaminopyrimidine deaminase/5-amino-6-(5-phosphoribosylamino)uracil reductase RibD [Gammaproteobacteria bacterium]MCP4832003.1